MEKPNLKVYLGARSIVRNPTERSRLSEAIVRDFLASSSTSVEVPFEQAGCSLEWLYKGLWNTCQKAAYKGIVTASMRDGKLILKRIG